MQLGRQVATYGSRLETWTCNSGNLRFSALTTELHGSLVTSSVYVTFRPLDFKEVTKTNFLIKK